MTKLHTAMSRYADKFAVRMPDDMRGKFVSLAKQRAISMNTAIIQGLTSYLDSLEELRILIEGNRLLRKSLIEKQEALDAGLTEVAELKAQLESALGIAVTD